MLNGKLISSKEIILKIIRDNGYQTQDFTFSDIIEWIGEVIGLIGCPYSLRKDVALIDIKNHRGTLPCNFDTPIQCSAFDCRTGVQIPMRTATNTFHPLIFKNGLSAGIFNTNEPISFDADGNPIYNFMNYEESINKNVAVDQVLHTFTDSTYELNDSYIFTSFKDGAKVLFSYYAIPLDKEGFPMIPDNQKWREACAAHVRYKIDYKLLRQGKISRPLFDISERERDWYIGAATTAGLIPDIDTMQSWKNILGTLIPRANEHDTFFINSGDVQRINFGGQFFRY